MRQTRILSVALHNPRSETDRVEKNLDNILGLLDVADQYDPDFVCFPEVALQHAAVQDGVAEELAQPIPGPATEAVSEKASALDSYVVLPMYERDGGHCYNAAALIDPDGDVRGVYRKVAPTVGEMDGGLTPGEDVPVWDTEFGRVGICICWDVKYPEVGSRLARQGADLVLHPTHGSGFRRFQTWAQYYGFEVAFCDKHGARVFSPVGTDVAGNANEWNLPEVDDLDLHAGTARLSFAEVNTDTDTYPRSPVLSDVMAAYRGDVVMHERSDEGVVVLESISEDVSLADLEREFDDLEPSTGYEERTRQRVLREVDDSPLS
jgi:hypothetical protein